ncbi:MAG: hypothetical protein IKR59_04015 [Lachnospiraceae bacterium]|nr:hypothetical protein [Lachnospiraceae bacterium]
MADQPVIQDAGGKFNLLGLLDKASVNYRSIIDAINEELAEVRLDNEKRAMLADDLGVSADEAARWQTVNDVVKHFDLAELAKKHPDAAKSLAVNIFLGVGTACPALLSVAALLKVIPADVLAKVNGWTLAASPDHLAHMFISRQAEKKAELYRQFTAEEAVETGRKQLVIVCPDDELFAMILRMIEEYNRTPDIAVFGQKVQVARWTEEKWYYRMKRGLIYYPMLIVGKIKGTKEFREIMNVKAAEYGVRCGFLGETVFIDTDASALRKKADYEEFLSHLAELPVPDYIRRSARTKMNFGTGVKIAFATPLIAKDLYDDRKEITRQQLFYGAAQFCYFGLEELMGGNNR